MGRWGSPIRKLLLIASEIVARGARLAFCALLFLVLIPSGSVDFATLHMIAIPFCLIAVLANVFGPRSDVRVPYAVGLIVTLVVAGWIVAQSLMFMDNPLANPIWSEAEKFYGAMPKSISVSPGDTLQGLVAATLPFVVFLTALSLMRTEQQVTAMLHAVTLAGLAICILGLIQYFNYPHSLVFGVKQFYIGSLTGVFINRNTAANYIAMVLIFAGGFTFRYLLTGGSRSPWHRGRAPQSSRLPGLFYLAAFCTMFVALMLTQSRAGIASGVVGLAATGALLAFGEAPAGGESMRFSRAARRSLLWRRLLRTFLVIFLVGAGVVIFAGQALQRYQVQSGSELRLCNLPSLLRMTADTWLLGTGFGTFRDVFPAYRDPACGMDGVLVQAHNFYLEGWIGLGIVFPIAAAVVIVGLVWYLVKGFRTRQRYRWVPASGIGVLVLQILHNCVDFSLQNPGVAVVFAALMGGCTAIAIRPSKATSARAAPSLSERSSSTFPPPEPASNLTIAEP
jgi:hypothetical protein